MRGVNPGEVWMIDFGMAANVRSALLSPSLLQQIAKFFHRHPGIFYYPAHRQSVHRVVTRYGDEMRTVAHDNVFALADNLKSRLFERLHGPEMIDAGNFRHLLNRYFHFAHVGTTNTFVYGGKIIRNGVANVLHCLLLGFSLRPATGERWAIHRVTLVRLMKHDLISEAHFRTLHPGRAKLQRTLCPSFSCPTDWRKRINVLSAIPQSAFRNALSFLIFFPHSAIRIP